MPKLIFHSGDFAGKAVGLPAGKSIVLGRNPDVDLPLPDQHLSRRHCQISANESQCFVRDLGSRNGTFLNGKRIEVGTDIEFLPFDRLVLGATEVELHPSESAERLVPEALDAGVLGPGSSRAFTPPTGLTAVKATPLDFALNELRRPLPPEPPPLPDLLADPRENHVLFCDSCHCSIPSLQYDLGLARDVSGKLCCKSCIESGKAFKTQRRESSSGDRPSGVDEILAGLETEAVLVDTSSRPRITFVERDAEAERRNQSGLTRLTPEPKDVPVDLGDEFEEIR